MLALPGSECRHQADPTSFQGLWPAARPGSPQPGGKFSCFVPILRDKAIENFQNFPESPWMEILVSISRGFREIHAKTVENPWVLNFFDCLVPISKGQDYREFSNLPSKFVDGGSRLHSRTCLANLPVFLLCRFGAGGKILIVYRFLRNGTIEDFQIRGIFPGDAFEAPARFPTDEGGTKSCLPRQANQLTCNPRSVNP